MPETEQAEQIQSKPAPTGVDLLHSLFERIAAQELRIQELERCKHDSHNIMIGDEALKQIAQYMKRDIAQTLAPVVSVPAEKQEELV